MTDTIQRHYDALDEDQRYLFDEHAGKLEHGANMPRYVAERMAHRFICRLIKKEREAKV